MALPHALLSASQQNALLLPLRSSAATNTTWAQHEHYCRKPRTNMIMCRANKSNSAENTEEEEEDKRKPSWLEALDFSQVRSQKDAQLLSEARQATKSGDKMSREQYGALRRKIGGTYKDFFKSYVEVEGQYLEEGWVDKTCKICKKDTRGEERTVDKSGKYVHLACLDKPTSGNFFTRLFSS